MGSRPPVVNEVTTRRRPPAVAVAAGLAALYGAVLVAVAALVLFEFVTGTGAVGSLGLDPQGVKGVLTLGVLLPLGALLLWRGAALLVRNRDPRLLALPLLLVLVFGSIGEVVDLVGTATATSDLIGAGILALAACPLVLLSLPGSRRWLAIGWLPRAR